MNSNNKNIVITSAVRTAVGTFKGSLKNMQGHDLGSVVIKGAMEKSKLKMNEVDEHPRAGMTLDIFQRSFECTYCCSYG